ncbi:MAG: hypothetical protein HYS18_12965 [Burkholderiales bacterium]|nr:hypothetical protein [Burkholderiales bacterium]
MNKITLEPFFYWYIAAWFSLCVTAIVLCMRDPASFSFTSPQYRRFLGVPWKLVTFAIAATAMTVVAPYTGDPTWDYVDAAFMSILTFAGAPWVVGTLYLFARRKEGGKQLYVAFCLWMFSASWSYDIYLVFRDGAYPLTWFANIFASSVLYISAGLLWSLDWRPGRGTTFSFLESDWPAASATSVFTKLFWVALPFFVIGVGSILYFFI